MKPLDETSSFHELNSCFFAVTAGDTNMTSTSKCRVDEHSNNRRNRTSPMLSSFSSTTSGTTSEESETMTDETGSDAVLDNLDCFEKEGGQMDDSASLELPSHQITILKAESNSIHTSITRVDSSSVIDNNCVDEYMPNYDIKTDSVKDTSIKRSNPHNTHPTNKDDQEIVVASLQEEIETWKQKYNELMDILAKKDQLLIDQRHFMANAAHDLKTPVTATINSCQHIQDLLRSHQANNKLSTSIQATLSEVINANQFMMISIHRCMEYAKVADGLKLIPKLETCNLTECIYTIVHCCLSSSYDKNKVRLSSLSNDICNHIVTDKQWLQENMLCLLSNAVKFTPMGKYVDLRVKLVDSDDIITDSKPITALDSVSEFKKTNSGMLYRSHSIDRIPSISTAVSPSSILPSCKLLLIEIEDQGVGISKDMQSKLFAPFQQAQKHAGGTGLGLYSLSKRIEALGGTYGVRDRLDGQQGSLFWFAIPYRPDQITAAYHEEHIKTDVSKHYDSCIIEKKGIVEDIHSSVVMSNHAGQPLRRMSCVGIHSSVTNMEGTVICEVHSKARMRVLLADDSFAMRKISTRILEQGGYEVITVTNGLEAIQMIESTNSNNPFDVMIVDIFMPVLDGIETIRRVRELEHDGKLSMKLPIIAYSANDEDSNAVAEALAAGANGFLSKPFTIEQFDKCVCTCCSKVM